jgi:hypothetical protein
MSVFHNKIINENLIGYRRGIIETINNKKVRLKQTEELLDSLLGHSAVSIK